MEKERELSFEAAVEGLLAGDFSRFERLFQAQGGETRSRIVQWFEEGCFEEQPEALREALTCASFNGCVEVAEYLLACGVDASGGMKTGLNAVHWAANRGQLEVVRLLLRYQAPLETLNSYGGTVLGCAVWSAIHESKPKHLEIVEELIRAGARTEVLEFPTGHPEVDGVLRKYCEGR